MQIQRRSSDWWAGLVLAGALILGSSGAQADSAAGDSGPVCSSAQSQEPQDSSLENFLDQVRGQAALRRGSGAPDPDGYVVLNNRGYNYTTRYESSPRHAPQRKGADQNR